MNIHKNARTTPYSRAEIVRRVMVLRETPRAVATALGVSQRTIAKWLARYRAEGEAGLADRSSRPHRMPGATPTALVEQIVALRRQRITGKQIAKMLSVSCATVSRVLRKARLSRMRDLDPPEPVRRYERAHPGELIHIDIKKLGRFERVGHRITGVRTRQGNPRSGRRQPWCPGWEFVHVCIDDASRIAFSQILPDEKKESAVAFLQAAVAYYKRLGVTVTRVMTDNGSCYKSFAFRDACKALSLKHIRTKPYTPKTNGKAERFIQTSLREWAYARPYPTSDHRKDALEPWLHNYNGEYLNAPFFFPNPNPPYGNRPLAPGDATGNWAERAPRHTFNVGVVYDVPVGDDGNKFTFNANLSYVGKFYWQPDNLTVQRPYQLLDSQLKYTFMSGKAHVTIWGANLLDERYYSEAIELGRSAGTVGVPAAPRTFGIKAGISF